jgi:predicted nucleic acid-binding protein
MVLVDTSVLIDWLSNKENEKSLLFDSLVSTNAPFGISILTYQEILQGARDNEYEKLKAYLSTQDIYYLSDTLSFYDHASQIYKNLKSQGITIRNTIDILIATTAITNKLSLLHNDKDFDFIAKVEAELIIFK